MMSQAASSFLDALYVRCLKREPDPAGRALFQRLITYKRWSFEQIASAMMQSEEYKLVNALSSPVRQPTLQRPRLCFIHIEKTAGTSLHDYLLEIYGPSELFPERYQYLDQHAPDEYLQHRLYSGHYNLSDCHRIPAGTRFITFLRNPEERLLSLYYFWRSVRSQDHGEEVRVAKTCGLAEFLRHPITQGSIHNAQVTRLLPYGASGAEAACEAVESFDLVGIRELYALSLLIIADKYKWPIPSRLYQRLGPDELRSHPNHRHVEREPLTPEIAELLRERTHEDYVLYEHALRRFAHEFLRVFGIELPPEQLRVLSRPVCSTQGTGTVPEQFGRPVRN